MCETNYEVDLSDEVVIGEVPDQPSVIVAPPDTIVYCHSCHDCAAPEYRLRRSCGKYILLCHRPGTADGCWGRTAKPMCAFKDQQGIQCTNAAEFHIAFGRDMLMQTSRCVLHVAPALTDVGEHRVFAI